MSVNGDRCMAVLIADKLNNKGFSAEMQTGTFGFRINLKDTSVCHCVEDKGRSKKREFTLKLSNL